MEKLLRLTKAHWKKMVIASAPVAYGINYIRDDYQTSRDMRYICNVVNQYSIPKNNKVLVVLNPVANRKKCEKTFKKYYEPVLHMAGYAVDVVKTKYIGHAKSLMEELEQLPDIIVVAGGDGTSSEVVTGLIRRNAEICPILFLPLGEKNKSSLSLMQNKNGDENKIVQNVSQCILALVQGRMQYRPSIKYQLIENNSVEQTKPIFGIHAFSWGIIKDIEMNKDKYWYFGTYKHHASALIALFSKRLYENMTANIISTPVCPGCIKCNSLVQGKTWFNFSNLSKTGSASQPVLQKECKLCSTEKCYKINAKQIDITCKQNSESILALNTQITKDIESQSYFLINMITENKVPPSILLESRTIEVIPIQTEHKTFYIDGEGYDARHIKVSLLPNAFKYFTLANDEY